MINLGMEPRPPATTSETAERALSFISKGWREVRDSAGADIQLMRARAKSFKSIADRELENFINSASSPFAFAPAAASPAELELVKRIQPKISEFRRAYSSPDFSRKVFEKWAGPQSRILPGIRDAIISEADENGALWDLDRIRGRRTRARWKGWREEEWKEWEPIRLLKKQLKEFERKSQSSDIFGGFKNSEFVEKLKLSLKSICKESQESKVESLTWTPLHYATFLQ